MRTGSALESMVDEGALATFLTARLRGDFGSIAMAPNPLCVYINALWLENEQILFIRARRLPRCNREPRWMFEPSMADRQGKSQYEPSFERVNLSGERGYSAKGPPRSYLRTCSIPHRT